MSFLPILINSFDSISIYLQVCSFEMGIDRNDTMNQFEKLASELKHRIG